MALNKIHQRLFEFHCAWGLLLVIGITTVLTGSVQARNVAPAEQKLNTRPLKYAPKIFLVGYDHSGNLPLSLAENFGYFKAMGFTHLVLEVRPSYRFADTLTQIVKYETVQSLKQGSSVDGFFGHGYGYFVKAYHDAGFKIVYGDTDKQHDQSLQELKSRDRHFIEVLDGIVRAGGKALLVIGAFHIQDLARQYYDRGLAKEVYPYYALDENGQTPCANSMYSVCRTFDLGFNAYLAHDGY